MLHPAISRPVKDEQINEWLSSTNPRIREVAEALHAEREWMKEILFGDRDHQYLHQSALRRLAGD